MVMGRRQYSLVRLLLLSLLLFTASPHAKANPNRDIGAIIVETALRMVGIVEHGYNRGDSVEAIQRNNGGKPGQSWCGWTIAEILRRAGATEPKYRGGMAQGYINKRSIRATRVAKGYYRVSPGYIAVWAKYKGERNTGSGHVGIVVRQIANNKVLTVEGNTSNGEAGSQSDGDGIYKRTRMINLYGNFRIIYFTPTG